MSETSRRAVLLARPGAACERLRSALADAGANLVLEADPTTLDPARLGEVSPQVIVVALDPVTEDLIERFDPVLADPSVEVIYEEAALAATREGWDLARWVRHLAAKLHGHGDVLPPGHEPEDAEVPDPKGTPVASHDASNDASWSVASAPVEMPAVQLAEVEVHATSAPTLEREPEAAVPPPVEREAAPPPIVAPAFNAFDPVAAEADFGMDTPIEIEATFADLDLPLVTEEPVVSADAGDLVIEPFESSFDYELADAPAPVTLVEATPEPVLVFEASRQGSLAPIELAPELQVEPAIDAPKAATPAAPDWSFADEAPAARQSKQDHRFQRDLGDLERRISSLELVEDRPAARVDGAVLVLAGIGGPDAVRQLLGGLPEGFPRPVLVQQRLDGGRYDRLVAQMQRATPLQVRLAEPGLIAMPGTIYILPADIGATVTDSGIRFADDGSDVLTALPSADSAVLLLSGSDPARVDAAMNHSWAGALVAGQAPDGCYDAAAATALIARGGESGQPAELAARLAARWR
ncbi:chemotaxis protein CheB [Lysobacter sp.]|uniref:chemotaxis protein CheB n=1 Tax=Lysobacter sp. TaxID=72226 RepID=UPI002D4B57C1|nr:chemotaxis protein CheB [Lysobacter sp.]HZX77160.1 chemotaxis protein CheB [Lysobacter sp.]